jgi:hypothetical protein
VSPAELKVGSESARVLVEVLTGDELKWVEEVGDNDFVASVSRPSD